MTNREHHLAIAGFIFFVVLILSMIPKAHSRDNGQYAGSPNKAWFDSLRSVKGPCCSDADGHVLTDVDWESHDGHYRVRIDGEWWDVPDEAVLQQPNRDGRTIVWPMYQSFFGGNLSVQIRCFIVGAQG
jgi:hypothetical protein